ncbi:DUF3307 domain-containing protein [Streptomyces sp. NPDC097941]|uniref:DUF3307 domain-containing protein n=1 Tax=Streptomyces sp. NPDC097941 TaxID=3155685 RepID=UPI003321BE02
MLADVFVLLLAAHWAADYPGQTDHQARHKSEHSALGWRANLAHAVTHVVLSVVLLGIGALLTDEVTLMPSATAFALGWVGISHGFIDRGWPGDRWMSFARQSGFKAHGGAAHVDQAAHVLLGLLPAALLLATIG